MTTDFSHVEVTTTNASTNIQHMFTRLQLQQLHKLLTTHAHVHAQFQHISLLSDVPMRGDTTRISEKL